MDYYSKEGESKMSFLERIKQQIPDDFLSKTGSYREGFNDALLRALDIYIEDQKERNKRILDFQNELIAKITILEIEKREYKQKLQTFYDNLKSNIVVDNKLGYHVAMETQELLKIVEELLK